LLALGLSGAVFTPKPASACGPSPSPTYTLSAVSPSEGSSGVPRDAGIIVSGAASGGPAGWGLPALVDLIDVESGERVPVSEVSWFSPEGGDVTMAVHPAEPLGPQRRYRVEATVRSDATPLDAFGNEDVRAPLISTFVTSDVLLEPLVLSGGLELSLRGGEVDALAYGECGPTVTGKRRALIADVRLPVPSGGQGVYRGDLHFSDNSPVFFDEGMLDAVPHNVSLTQFAAFEAGDVLTLTQEIFEEGEPYAGCFALSVWDPAGHVARASACLPTLSAEEIAVLTRSGESIHLATDDATAADQVDEAVADARTRDLSCALGASGSSATPAWLALLLAVGLVRRGRSRG
jgi:hypothetical protein